MKAAQPGKLFHSRKKKDGDVLGGVTVNNHNKSLQPAAL